MVLPQLVLRKKKKQLMKFRVLLLVPIYHNLYKEVGKDAVVANLARVAVANLARVAELRNAVAPKDAAAAVNYSAFFLVPFLDNVFFILNILS
jgi:hypothetical protein